MSNEAEQIIEWVERQWPDGPAFECAQLLRETLLKLDSSDQRNTILEVENTKLEERLAGARQGRDDALRRLDTIRQKCQHEIDLFKSRAAETAFEEGRVDFADVIWRMTSDVEKNHHE